MRQKAQRPGAKSADSLMPIGQDKKAKTAKGPERDFFGRILPEGSTGGKAKKGKPASKVWVTYQDGFSKAVRKPISMIKLMEGL